MTTSSGDPRQKPSDQRDAGLLRLGDILPQVLARAGVTQEPQRQEVASVRVPRSRADDRWIQERVGQLVAT
jgi:hypothetical protein